LPVSASRRNRLWEARGLLDLIERMETGDMITPPNAEPSPV
jgi:hypothetical protein